MILLSRECSGDVNKAGHRCEPCWTMVLVSTNVIELNSDCLFKYYSLFIKINLDMLGLTKRNLPDQKIVTKVFLIGSSRPIFLEKKR